MRRQNGVADPLQVAIVFILSAAVLLLELFHPRSTLPESASAFIIPVTAGAAAAMITWGAFAARLVEARERSAGSASH